MNVIATAGRRRSTRARSSPPASQTRSRSRIAATGAANSTAARGQPAYHWPSPGQTNDRKAAIAGERDFRAWDRSPLESIVTSEGV